MLLDDVPYLHLLSTLIIIAHYDLRWNVLFSIDSDRGCIAQGFMGNLGGLQLMEEMVTKKLGVEYSELIASNK